MWWLRLISTIGFIQGMRGLHLACYLMSLEMSLRCTHLGPLSMPWKGNDTSARISAKSWRGNKREREFIGKEIPRAYLHFFYHHSSFSRALLLQSHGQGRLSNSSPPSWPILTTPTSKKASFGIFRPREDSSCKLSTTYLHHLSRASKVWAPPFPHLYLLLMVTERMLLITKEKLHPSSRPRKKEDATWILMSREASKLTYKPS